MHETIDIRKGLTYDPKKGVVIDTFVNDHLSFINDENLLGFSFSTAPDEDQVTNTRPDQPQALYNDRDSVSTLAKPGTSVITPSLSNNVDFSCFKPKSSDNTLVSSGMSMVTMDTIHSIEHRLLSLTIHLHNYDKRIEEIM